MEKLIGTMNLQEIFYNPSHSPKEKTQLLHTLILENPAGLDKVVEYAQPASNAIKIIAIEALQRATKTNPSIVTAACFRFITNTLAEKAPQLKWESAKVVGHTAHLHPENLEEPIKNLVSNSSSSGIMVRWCTAFALGEIVKINSFHNKDLIPVLQAISSRENNSNIKKIYAKALLHFK